MTRAPLPATETIETLPVVVLATVDGCNCRCVMCDGWRAPRQTVSLERVRAWLPSWRRLGVRRVALTGGEPLLHPELAQLLALMGSAGLPVTVITNGLLLEDTAEVVGSACDSVVVSLDGPEPVHDALRGVDGAFRRLAAGIDAVRRASPGIAVTARCTVQHGNHLELRAVVRCARELGLDAISFLAVDCASAAFLRHPQLSPPGLDGGGVRALAAEVEALIRAHAAELESGFISDSVDKLRGRIVQRFAARLGLAEEPAARCNAPWVSAVVSADGAVRPCFFHPAYPDLGDDLGEVVNAPAASAFRRSLDITTDAACRRCVCPLNLRHGEDPR